MLRDVLLRRHFVWIRCVEEPFVKRCLYVCHQHKDKTILENGDLQVKELHLHVYECDLLLPPILCGILHVRELMGWVRNVVLMNVYLDLENPGGRDFG